MATEQIKKKYCWERRKLSIEVMETGFVIIILLYIFIYQLLFLIQLFIYLSIFIDYI